jgi:hypothetical protein
MKDKILQVLGWARDKLRPLFISGGAMKYIVWYAALIVASCTLYMVSWCADFYITGRPDMIELRAFLHEIVSNPWVVMIGFIAKALIDRNKDGIPDEFEDQKGDDQK